jgi:hypothetical protein
MNRTKVPTRHRWPRDKSRTAAEPSAADINASNNDAPKFARVTQELLLPQVVRFLVNGGLPRANIVQKLRNLADMVEAGRSVPVDLSHDYELIVRISRVMHDWTRSPEYTANDGEPRPLNLRGPRGLVLLMRRHFPRHAVSGALHFMSVSGAICRRADGRYVLLQRHIIVGSHSEDAYLAWVTTLAAQYLHTAFENWKESNLSSRNLDRIARVFNLPEKEIPHFREFAKNRAESWLEEIDNWLEDHSSPKGRQRRVEAGVHVYGYVGSVQKTSGAAAANRSA